MLIYSDGRTALEHVEEVSLAPVQETLLRCAVRTVPVTKAEFLVAAQLLVHVIRYGLVDEQGKALAHARSILQAFEEGRIDASIMRHLREIAPLCRILEDDRPLLAISSLMEGLRNHVLK